MLRIARAPESRGVGHGAAGLVEGTLLVTPGDQKPGTLKGKNSHLGFVIIQARSGRDRSLPEVFCGHERVAASVELVVPDADRPEKRFAI